MWTRRQRWSTFACGLMLACVAPLATAMDLAPLRAQFGLPDERIDYAAAKLVVDRLLDPATDTDAVHRALDAWEQAVRGQLPAQPTPREVLAALLKTLYEPGPWNQGQRFEYDLSDPFGRNPANKRLATYLATRRGNCVSMPLLVLVLGQRLGLPVALATAPHHVLVKFADAGSRTWLNVEATAGGFKFDSSYERETGIGARAIANAIYLRPLAPREGLGVIASTLMEHLAARQDGDALMEVADMALAVNPKDPVATLWKANAYALQLRARNTDELRLRRANRAWFEQAEALGWVEPPPERDAVYLQSLRSGPAPAP